MIVYEHHRSLSGYEIYRQYDSGLCFCPHLHNSFELICAESGELLVTVDGEEFCLSAGEATLIFPNSIHSYRTPNASQSRLYVFSGAYIRAFDLQHQHEKALCPIFPLDVSELSVLDDETADIYLVKSALYKIVHLLCKNTDFVGRDARGLELCGRILSYISIHCTEDITAKDVAVHLGYDYRYISTLIQKGLHRTFRQILNEYRVAHAQYLLVTESKPVAEVAYECGYESLCSFNRNFKFVVGTTPRVFRESAQK